ncbi:MAG: NADH-quinone oxidoreductase subunit J [Fuerstiella sp.]|nr:NADH-quinone oxidoreductase subunit J [Fuerstiella sp.]
MSLFFTIFALAACLGAVAVVISQSVVRMAFWLIVSLGSVAGLFFLADADFIGAAQLLIYVGGTLVLLVFGIMLTASGPYMKIPASPGETVVAGLIGVMFLSMVFSTLPASKEWKQSPNYIAETVTPEFADSSEGNTLRPLGFALLGVRPDVGQDGAGYLLPFEIASVHLLVVLIGAAYLARAKRRQDNA